MVLTHSAMCRQILEIGQVGLLSPWLRTSQWPFSDLAPGPGHNGRGPVRLRRYTMGRYFPL